MHVVVDVRMLKDAGIGRYIRNVVPRVMDLKPDWEFTLLTPRDSGDAAAWGSPGRVRLQPCDSAIYSLREQIEIPVRGPRADVFWSPHYNVPLLSRTPLVVTVHDVIHLAMPAIFGGGMRRLYAREMFAAVRRSARAVIFDSAFTRAEFTQRVGAPQHSTVVHLGVDATWSAPVDAARPTRPHLLFVGSIKPHKNLGMLLRAFEQMLPDIDHDLLIVGNHKGQRTVDTDALAAAARLGSRVRVVENADDASLRQYVAQASALVFPSLYEGFGLPAIEAMAAGTPCIVSTAGSLPEVCGDAALYCNPLDANDLATQIKRLLSDEPLRARLVTAGRARASQFDWDRTTRDTVAVFEQAVSA
jgi:glycosyltransferase involved in cell wall biosynthesis